MRRGSGERTVGKGHVSRYYKIARASTDPSEGPKWEQWGRSHEQRAADKVAHKVASFVWNIWGRRDLRLRPSEAKGGKIGRQGSRDT
jgi:hypothetical protein